MRGIGFLGGSDENRSRICGSDERIGVECCPDEKRSRMWLGREIVVAGLPPLTEVLFLFTPKKDIKCIR